MTMAFPIMPLMPNWSCWPRQGAGLNFSQSQVPRRKCCLTPAGHSVGSAVLGELKERARNYLSQVSIWVRSLSFAELVVGSMRSGINDAPAGLNDGAGSKLGGLQAAAPHDVEHGFPTGDKIIGDDAAMASPPY